MVGSVGSFKFINYYIRRKLVCSSCSLVTRSAEKVGKDAVSVRHDRDKADGA